MRLTPVPGACHPTARPQRRQQQEMERQERAEDARLRAEYTRARGAAANAIADARKQQASSHLEVRRSQRRCCAHTSPHVLYRRGNHLAFCAHACVLRARLYDVSTPPPPRRCRCRRPQAKMARVDRLMAAREALVKEIAGVKASLAAQEDKLREAVAKAEVGLPSGGLPPFGGPPRGGSANRRAAG